MPNINPTREPNLANATVGTVKSVAPALVPDFGYSDLEVSDGSAASAAFYSIATGRLNATSEAEARDSLLAYCARDTLAMVKIHCAIRSLC